VLTKPQHVSICQFVQNVEQLNSYILQLPCWYYSPSAKTTNIPMKASFAEADLASHILQKGPYAWQDQFNLHKKGMTPMEMCLILLSLQAIEERSDALQMRKLPSTRKVASNLALKLRPKFLRKLTPRNIATFARSMGAHTWCTIPEIAIGLRKMEQNNLISALSRMAERNPIPPSSLLRS
jgi:hypothetical protein